MKELKELAMHTRQLRLVAVFITQTTRAVNE